MHYVASLVPSQHLDLTAIPTTAYTPLGSGPLAKLPVYRCQQTRWGAERPVVLLLSSSLRQGQSRGLHPHLHKRLDTLQQWQQPLAKPRSGPRTGASAQKQIERLLTGQYLRQSLHIDYDPQQTGAERLTWWIDHTALTWKRKCSASGPSSRISTRGRPRILFSPIVGRAVRRRSFAN